MPNLIQRSLRILLQRARNSQRLRYWLLGETGLQHSVLTPPPGAYLGGDRALEESWIITHLPSHPCRILDIGCAGALTAALCARLGHKVVGVDLNPANYDIPGFVFRQDDFNLIDLNRERFEVIISCSSVEHFGLEGRFGATAAPNADLEAMVRTANLLVPDEGKVLLTVPVGVDLVVSPWHRIYGPERLPRLLERYKIVEEEFWCKPDMQMWVPATKTQALGFQGNQAIYALGLFVLSPA